MFNKIFSLSLIISYVAIANAAPSVVGPGALVGHGSTIGSLPGPSTGGHTSPGGNSGYGGYASPGGGYVKPKEAAGESTNPAEVAREVASGVSLNGAPGLGGVGSALGGLPVVGPVVGTVGPALGGGL